MAQKVGGVSGTEVVPDAIHRQERLHLAGGAPVGQLGKLRPIVKSANRRDCSGQRR